jgi:hypothetical protein
MIVDLEGVPGRESPVGPLLDLVVSEPDLAHGADPAVFSVRGFFVIGTI